MHFFAFLLPLFTLFAAAACSDPQCMPDELRVGMVCRSLDKAQPDSSIATPQDVEGSDGSVTGKVAEPDAAGLRDGAASIPPPPDGGDAASRPTGDAILKELPGGPPSFQFRADTIMLSNGNVATIPNRLGADALVVQAGALQSAPSVPLGGQPALVFNGTQWAASSLPPTSWAFLANGAGCTIFNVFEVTSLSDSPNAIFTTRDISTTATDSGVTASQAFGTIGWASRAAGVVAFSSGNLGTVGIGDAVLQEASFAKPSKWHEVSLRKNGVLLAFNDATGSLAGTPSFSLRLGWNSFAFTRMNWAETLIFTRDLPEDERQLVRAYIASRYGIAAPASLPDPARQ